MKTLSGPLNHLLVTSQQYHRGPSLSPAGRYVLGGCCFGLVLSWIKAIHTRQDIEVLSWINAVSKRSTAEGRPIIHEPELFQLRFSTDPTDNADPAKPNYIVGKPVPLDVEKRREEAFRQEAAVADAGDYEPDVTSPFWLSTGLQPKKCGVMGRFRLLQLLDDWAKEPGASPRILTYELGANGHSVGIATDGTDVAFFDANKYIRVYPKAEAIDSLELMSELGHRPYYVCKLSY